MVDHWVNYAEDIWDIPGYALSCCGEGNLHKQTSWACPDGGTGSS
eukprot:CAMPEP_0181434080 /NCGR_PEP_ID=MMETSP1110-20121109/19634_1 /TAXON_ID=174948 /ORGANISM="Symbiodinium sp., Strain CCMP421" /LENGTH=44 /DNA_ID= /DNA_START= /DNA_END= /DNA_ORIENTATION=